MEGNGDPRCNNELGIYVGELQSSGKPGVLATTTEGVGPDIGIYGLWLLVLPVLDMVAKVLTNRVAYDGLEERVLHDHSLGGCDFDRHLHWRRVSGCIDQARI